MRTGPLRYDIDSRPKITKKNLSEKGSILFCAIGVIVVGALILLTMSGCASIDKVYVAADRATYEAIAPRYLNYLENDDSIRSWERDLYKELTKSWMERIQEAEK